RLPPRTGRPVAVDEDDRAEPALRSILDVMDVQIARVDERYGSPPGKAMIARRSGAGCYRRVL
ncbi:MAG: hypothetical protein ACXVB5_20875, partial [Isosphaeraceae bacterium]